MIGRKNMNGFHENFIKEASQKNITFVAGSGSGTGRENSGFGSFKKVPSTTRVCLAFSFVGQVPCTYGTYRTD
jgi:hypothetical protein